MTLYEFNQLPEAQQLATVFADGCYLAWRWTDGCGVKLYHLPGGVFVELYYDTHNNRLVRLRSFSNGEPLEDYAAAVRLPDEWI
jgi:hypothetical protein